jgi:hypothetical protein
MMRLWYRAERPVHTAAMAEVQPLVQTVAPVPSATVVATSLDTRPPASLRPVPPPVPETDSVSLHHHARVKTTRKAVLHRLPEPTISARDQPIDDYFPLTSFLRRAQALDDNAEFHGVLCGMRFRASDFFVAFFIVANREPTHVPQIRTARLLGDGTGPLDRREPHGGAAFPLRKSSIRARVVRAHPPIAW